MTSPGTVRRGRSGRRRRDEVMVPEATFTSYYGLPVVKPAPWRNEIPAYLFLGGLASGSAIIASGAELTGRVELQRNTRLIALGALVGSAGVLVADLGKPSRFLNMMRTVKLTSPMSVGSWILAGQGAFTSAAAACEAARFVVPVDGAAAQWLPLADRVASIGSASFAAPLAAYTAVLLSDTATPTWHEAYHELPFLFVASALAAGAGAALMTTAVEQCAAVRRLAVGAAVVDLLAYHRMTQHLGLVGEPLRQGRAGALTRTSSALTMTGMLLTLVAGRHRVGAVLAGAALIGGSLCTRFGVFEAGMASAKDPKYTVVPQRERLRRQAHGRGGEVGSAPHRRARFASIVTRVPSTHADQGAVAAHEVTDDRGPRDLTDEQQPT